MFKFYKNMQISFSALNFNSYNKQTKAPKYPNLTPLKQDTVSFSGRVPKDLMSLSPKRIIFECRKAIKEGIKLGEGQEAIAYKIEDYPQYCIRREKKLAGSPANFELNFKLTKYDKVNQVVAKLDDGTQIMKYIAGIPLKITSRDTADGKIVKNTVKGLVANNFSITPFKKAIAQIEDAKLKGIDFDRKGENMHIDALNQEIICFDFSPNFHDIEYNPISYIYSAMDVDRTEHAGKVFGKLCKAYAQRILEVPTSRLNLEHLDTHFYHRGFLEEPFVEFPDMKLLDETSDRLSELIEAKKDPSTPKDYLKYLVEEFSEFIDEQVMPLKKKSDWYSSFDFD